MQQNLKYSTPFHKYFKHLQKQIHTLHRTAVLPTAQSHSHVKTKTLFAFRVRENPTCLYYFASVPHYNTHLKYTFSPLTPTLVTEVHICTYLSVSHDRHFPSLTAHVHRQPGRGPAAHRQATQKPRTETYTFQQAEAPPLFTAANVMIRERVYRVYVCCLETHK
jgi:hypothetical protein